MNWLKQIFSRRRLYNHLSDEIQAHLEEKIDELLATSMPRIEAGFPIHAQHEWGFSPHYFLISIF